MGQTILPASFLHKFNRSSVATAGSSLGLAVVVVVGLASPLGAATDEAVTGRAEQEVPGSSELRHGQLLPPLPSLRAEMRRFDADLFLQDRQTLTRTLFDLRERLNSAIRPTPIEVDLLLDLAALHLSQRMLPEARSFLAALPITGTDGASPGGARMSPIQQGRAVVLAAALDGFSGGNAALPENWTDRPLFEALGHVGRADPTAAAPLVAQAAQILEAYPKALADPVRPQLLWAAIESGVWDVARDLAGQMEAGGDSAYRYLLGRAAELGGDLLAAFDNHAAAAAGTDEWAQRSRIALIDIGRATRTLTAEDARRLLVQTRAIWQGGPLGLATLQRLAALELTDRRDLPALDALADIIRFYPETKEAAAAEERAWNVIETVYARGLEKGVPLSAFMAAHRAIAADFRFDRRFDPLAETLADHLVASGASGLAAAEYGDLRGRIVLRKDRQSEAVSADDTQAAALDVTRDRLLLKEAAALMQGGQLSEAETLLSMPLVGADKDLRDRYNLIRAQLFAATGRHDDVLSTRMVSPSGDYLRLRAKAAFALSDWDAAREAYEQLWRSMGTAMPKGDRINLLLATHRSGDAERLHALIQSFPDLGDQWAGLAAGLNAKSPDVLPLRGDAARERVDNADSALRLLQAAGGNAMP
jgi:tetratricopeptide (TPR) repeat protein